MYTCTPSLVHLPPRSASPPLGHHRVLSWAPHATPQAATSCPFTCCLVSKSCLFCDPMDFSLLCPWDFPGRNIGVGYHFLLQGIFLIRDRTCIVYISRQVPYCQAIVFLCFYGGLCCSSFSLLHCSLGSLSLSKGQTNLNYKPLLHL